MLGRESHLLATFGILLHHANGVEVGLLSIPHKRIGEFELCLHGNLFLVRSEIGSNGLLGHLLAHRVVERHLKHLLACKAITVVECEVNVGFCLLFVSTGKLGVDVVVAHRYGGHVIYIHITEDTAHAEHILTLEV